MEDPDEIYKYYNPQVNQVQTKDIMSLDEKIEIVDVWKDNFIEELEKIIELTQRFNVIAMDTEFPGIIVKNQKRYDYPDDVQEYALIRENVKETKVIQIGISIADEQGKVPYPISTWQFNFRFDRDKDQIHRDSLRLLENAGIDFRKFYEKGIDQQVFSEYFMNSDLVLNEEIIWVAFHGGHDFAYLIKMLLNNDVPDKAETFYQQIQYFFPNVYDIKYMIKDMEKVKEFGLARLGSDLRIDRIGPQHQAGSDSLMTLQVFFKLRDGQFKDKPDLLKKVSQVIFGIGKGYINSRVYTQNQDELYGNNYQDFIPQSQQINQQYMYFQPPYNSHYY